jgi:hypothetical protein
MTPIVIQHRGERAVCRRASISWGVCRNGTPSSRRTTPQSCVDARSAEIGRHDHFDRFREDVELTQTRQSPTRHIVRLE